MSNYQKARNWLDNKTVGYGGYPLYALRDGKAEYIGLLYKIPREDRSSVWYCVEFDAKKIKRICLY